MTSESTSEDRAPGKQPKDRPESVLFPRLSPEEYKARVLRYVYILMRLLFAALAVIVIWWLSGELGALLFPLTASLVLAYLLNPLIDRFERRGLSRRLGIIVCLSGAVVVIGLAALFLVPPLVQQIGAIIGDIPKLIETIRTEWVPWVEERLRTQLPAAVRTGLEQSGQRAAESLPQMAQRAGTWTLGAVSKTGQLLYGLFNVLLVPLFAYYFLRKFTGLKQTMARWLPVRRRDYTLRLLGRMDSAVGDWFRGQVQVAVIIGVLYSIGLAIAFAIAGIDPKLGVAIGIIAGVLNIIPYFGMIVASLLTTVVVLLNWPGFGGVLAVVIVFLINQFLEGYVIGPKILGNSVGLNPIAVIILLLIGGELAGIWGMLIIVPTAGAIRIVWPDLMAIYRETAFYQGGVMHAEQDSEH
jgi:predicted PurR-regulated permease PerM